MFIDEYSEKYLCFIKCDETAKLVSTLPLEMFSYGYTLLSSLVKCIPNVLYPQGCHSSSVINTS